MFTAAFAKGEGFLQHENPPAFLYRTARNLTLTYLKRRRLYAEEALCENIAGGDIDLFDRISRDRDRKIDETAYTGLVLGRLSGKERALYERRYVEGRPIREVAAEQGVSEPAMRMRLVRLRQEIRSIVRELKLEEK